MLCLSKKLFSGCHFLLIILPIALCACTTSVVNHTNLRATDLERISETEQSKDKGKKLENLSPEELVYNGRTHLAKGNIPLAKLHFLVALKKAPESSPAYLELAKTLELEGFPQKADEIYRVLLEKQPNNISALVGRGRLQREQGATEKALEILKKANDIDSSDVEALTELAITYDILGKEPLAEMLYLTVVGLQPELPSAHNNLGFNYMLQKRYPEAISAFHKALAMAPQDKRIQNNLATGYALNGQNETALEIFENSMDQHSAYNNLGYIYMTQGKNEEAKKALQRALDLNPVFYTRAKKNLEQLRKTPIKPNQQN